MTDPDYSASAKKRPVREKKSYVVLTFRSTIDAIAMERNCGRYGIPGRLIPVPREISASCGLAWRMPKEEYPPYQKKINDLELNFESAVELML